MDEWFGISWTTDTKYHDEGKAYIVHFVNPHIIMLMIAEVSKFSVFIPKQFLFITLEWVKFRLYFEWWIKEVLCWTWVLDYSLCLVYITVANKDFLYCSQKETEWQIWGGGKFPRNQGIKPTILFKTHIGRGVSIHESCPGPNTSSQRPCQVAQSLTSCENGMKLNDMQ